MHKTLEAYFGKNEFTAKKGLDPDFRERHFARMFTDKQIVSTVSRQLSCKIT